MKNVLKLMETVNERTIAPFIKWVLIFMALNIASFLFKVNETSNSYINIHHFVFIEIIWVLITVFVLHIRRLRRVIGEGGFTRLRLLPIPPTTYFFSEVCFVTMTLLLMLAGYYISIGILYALFTILVSPIENGFIYMILWNKDLITLMPLTIGGVLTLLAQVLLIALSITIFLMSMYAPGRLIKYGFLLFFGCMIAFFIRMSLPGTGSYIYAQEMYLVLNMSVFVMDALLIWYGVRLFKKHKIGG